jgi:glycosyltransferase involved in cell wall biosynthesis
MVRISIVTPSYNQGDYLEETLESVLSQGIPGLELIVMDGGSTDQSVEILRKYERHLSYWQSQPDGGQTQAIREGFRRATGDVLAWINSDDRYEPGTLAKVQREFETHPQLELLYGDYSLVYPDGRRVAKPKISFDFNMSLHAFLMIPQPSSFWTRRLYEAVGGLNPRYQYAFDYDFFLRVGKHLEHRPEAIRHVQDLWSLFRVHGESKSVSLQERFMPEYEEILAQFDVPARGLMREVRKNFELFRTLRRYYQERGFVPIRKEAGKA